jgi:hypothetical protein
MVLTLFAIGFLLGLTRHAPSDSLQDTVEP